MANTYTQIYIHVIFAVRGRQNLIHKQFKEELHKYITGIITHKKQKLISINSVSDHIHMLIGLKPEHSLSDLIRDVKANSSKFINEKKWIREKFNWQNGFGAFSYSHSQLGRIIRYIEGQENHHKKKTFRDEYIEILKKYEIEFKNEYLFQWIDNE